MSGEPRRSGRYRPEILAALDTHGFRPSAGLDPSRVYELLKSIYTFEIREAKQRHRERERILGPQPLDPYRADVARLKARYAVLRIPPHHWVEESPGGAGR